MQSINFEDFERNTSPYSNYVERLAKAFCTSKRIVAITGAGISVSAGIPDFRSAGGLYERVRLKYAPQKNSVKGKDFFDVNFFLQPDSRPLFYQFIAELKESCNMAQPTPTHHFLKELATQGRLTRWYTQNIDCLEERLGLSCWSSAKEASISGNTVVSLHGTLSQVSCTLCKIASSLTNEHMSNFKAGKEPTCKSCFEAALAREASGRRKLRSGFLRPDIVLYNEPHPHGDTIAEFVSADLSKQPNLLLVMGTSLKIGGLKKMIKDFAKNMKSRNGGEKCLIVFVNKTPCSKAEWQGIFDYELVGECDKWIEVLQEEFYKIKKGPKVSKKPISEFIPSSPLQRSSSISVTEAEGCPSSPVLARKKQQLTIQQSEKVLVTIKSQIQPQVQGRHFKQQHQPPTPTIISKNLSSPLEGNLSSGRLITEFFTPIKNSKVSRITIGKGNKILKEREKNDEQNAVIENLII